MGVLDETAGRAVLHLAYPEDGAFEVSAQVPVRADDPSSAPRLYIQQVDTPEPGPAFAAFRASLDQLAPGPPVAASFRQMWNGWYVSALRLEAAVLLEDRELALSRLQLAELLLAEAESLGAASGAERQESDKLKAEAAPRLDFAIDELRAMKMQPWLERALRHKGLLHA